MSLIGQLKMYYKGSFLSQTLLWVEVSLPNWVRSIIYFDDITKKPKREVISPILGNPGRLGVRILRYCITRILTWEEACMQRCVEHRQYTRAIHCSIISGLHHADIEIILVFLAASTNIFTLSPGGEWLLRINVWIYFLLFLNIKDRNVCQNLI